jgi:hypothetical protein
MNDPHPISGATHPFAQREWNALLSSVIRIWERASPRPWLLGAQSADWRDRKLELLAAAEEDGARVPPGHVLTVVEPGGVGDRNWVAKAINGWEEIRPGKFFNTRLLSKMDAKGLESRRLDGPLWLQTYLKHERELRVFIAGNSEFAVQLASFSSSIVDFRLLDSTNADAQIVVVPPELSVTARRLMKRLGLNYCVFDIIVDADGTFWFVDVNPLGTWDYLEKDFGLSLTDKIVNGALSL